MNEITKNLFDRSKADMSNYLTGLYDSGYNAKEMAGEINKHLLSKIRSFYQRKEADEIKIESFIGTSLDMIKDKVNMNGDSKAERIFYNILEENNIQFNFQYPIGPYKIDFLIAKAIIFEGDGQQHRKTKQRDDKRDAYLEQMGYVVMRVEWTLVAMSPEAVIEEIKNKIIELKL